MNRRPDNCGSHQVRSDMENDMWEAISTPIEPGRLVRIELEEDGRRASFRRVLEGWQNNAALCEAFNQTLSAAPFAGFRWECPPLTDMAADRDFECVLLRCDGLDRLPDALSFAEFFATAGSASVVGFPSMGRDAFLIAPCPLAESTVYPHLASFLRNAPSAQVHELWQRVGREVAARLSERPIWLSTAGMGVAWLHVRLDSRPKYYGHRPYTDAP